VYNANIFIEKMKTTKLDIPQPPLTLSQWLQVSFLSPQQSTMHVHTVHPRQIHLWVPKNHTYTMYWLESFCWPFFR